MSGPTELPADLLDPTIGPRLAGVLPDVAQSLGHGLEGRASAGLDLPPSSRVCVVLCDGLGLDALRARAGHAPTLRARLDHTVELVAGYPSTTAASLGSLGTGVLPGRTGLLGYTVKDPRTQDGLVNLVNLVSWTSGTLPPPDPEAWQPHRTVFDELVRKGVAVTSVGPARFAGSGLTQAALRGGRYVGAEGLAERVDATVAALRQPGLAYLYWGDVDKVGHHLGWMSPEWSEELAQFDYELGRLLRRLPRGTCVVVTADHGMVDVDRLVDLSAHPGLTQDVVLVAGEPRASHIHLTRQAQEDPEPVAQRWRSILGEDAWVLTRAEAVDRGLFGPVDERNAPLIGDLVVAARGRVALVDPRTQSAGSLTLVGMHGSLTHEELAIPALVDVV